MLSEFFFSFFTDEGKPSSPISTFNNLFHRSNRSHRSLPSSLRIKTRKQSESLSEKASQFYCDLAITEKPTENGALSESIACVPDDSFSSAASDVLTSSQSSGAKPSNDSKQDLVESYDSISAINKTSSQSNSELYEIVECTEYILSINKEESKEEEPAFSSNSFSSPFSNQSLDIIPENESVTPEDHSLKENTMHRKNVQFSSPFNFEGGLSSSKNTVINLSQQQHSSNWCDFSEDEPNREHKVKISDTELGKQSTFPVSSGHNTKLSSNSEDPWLLLSCSDSKKDSSDGFASQCVSSINPWISPQNDFTTLPSPSSPSDVQPNPPLESSPDCNQVPSFPRALSPSLASPEDSGGSRATSPKVDGAAQESLSRSILFRSSKCMPFCSFSFFVEAFICLNFDFLLYVGIF